MLGMGVEVFFSPLIGFCFGATLPPGTSLGFGNASSAGEEEDYFGGSF